VNGNNIFYVYEHWRPDTGRCFYVGKGRDRRAWDMKNDRNVHHMSVVSLLLSSGLSVDVRIVVKDLSCETAMALEKDRIALYGIENLTNMNRGGGGVLRHSPEALAKISAASKGRRARLGFKASPETKARLRELGIASLEIFKRHSSLGPKAVSKKVICLDDGMEFESASAAARHYGLKHGNSITEVCLKKKYRCRAAGRRFKYKDAA
jgi:hypothetical protein